MEVKNKVAVVSGGTSGLGMATARRLRACGARVAIIDADGQRVRALVDEGVHAWHADVTDAKRIEAVFDEMRDRLGAVAILVNCAGVATPGSVVRRDGPMPLAEFRRVVHVNLLGTLNTLRCAAAQMVDTALNAAPGEENGVIINTSSIAATEGQVGQAAYAASKGGVSSMTLPLARELGRYGVRVNAIAPGVFETPMTLSLPEKSREVVFSALPPYPSRPGKPEEFADLVSSIIAQPMVNGCVIRLDGGLRMPARY